MNVRREFGLRLLQMAARTSIAPAVRRVFVVLAMATTSACSQSAPKPSEADIGMPSDSCANLRVLASQRKSECSEIAQIIDEIEGMSYYRTSVRGGLKIVGDPENLKGPHFSILKDMTREEMDNYVAERYRDIGDIFAAADWMTARATIMAIDKYYDGAYEAAKRSLEYVGNNKAIIWEAIKEQDLAIIAIYYASRGDKEKAIQKISNVERYVENDEIRSIVSINYIIYNDIILFYDTFGDEEKRLNYVEKLAKFMFDIGEYRLAASEYNELYHSYREKDEVLFGKFKELYRLSICKAGHEANC